MEHTCEKMAIENFEKSGNIMGIGGRRVVNTASYGCEGPKVGVHYDLHYNYYGQCVALIGLRLHVVIKCGIRISILVLKYSFCAFVLLEIK
jgi:hypothetical protein